MRRLAPDVINWLSLLAGMIALLAVPASAQQISAIKEATHEVDDMATWHRMLALRPRGNGILACSSSARMPLELLVCD